MIFFTLNERIKIRKFTKRFGDWRSPSVRLAGVALKNCKILGWINRVPANRKICGREENASDKESERSEF